MKKLLTLALALAVLATFGGLATSAHATETRDVCATDTSTYCPDVPRENGALIYCLFKKQNQLTAVCRDKVAMVHANINARRDECRPDAEKLCPGIKHGGGRINACLKEHLSELGQTCRKNVLSAMRQTPP